MKTKKTEKNIGNNIKTYEKIKIPKINIKFQQLTYQTTQYISWKYSKTHTNNIIKQQQKPCPKQVLKCS